MAYFLPKSLHQLGHDIRVITPYYPSMGKYHHLMKALGRAKIDMGGIETFVNYFELVYEDISYIFVQNMHYFEREGLYGYNDDAERFACFSYAILEGLSIFNFYPSILHLNDWQTGMIPFLLDEHYRKINDDYYSIHTLLTIHNLEYQGSFDYYVSRFFNTKFNQTYVHFGRVNFLKAGISRATKINTVSQAYQHEVLTSEYGFTLDGALLQRRDDFYGILNGIDTDFFHPKSDHLLEKNYDLRSFKSGKEINKAWLFSYFQLELNLNRPLVVYIGRLAKQKGVDLMMRILEDVVYHSDATFILMGSGEKVYEDYFRYLTDKHPTKVANYLGFNESIAHKVYAGADLFMMPSAFEPCGLGQLIAMQYGALPVARETGGLKDTVMPYNQYDGSGTGFTFRNYDAFEFKETLFKAIHLYHNEKSNWRNLVKQAMQQDYSLKKMALAYENLYQIIIGV